MFITMQDTITVQTFRPEFAEYFRRLNVEWLEKYFYVEPHDVEILSDPEAHIIATGGEIFFASFRGEIVGTCALIKHSDEEYELAKMAVTEKAQGKKIGKLLGETVVAEARRLGAKRIVLDTHTKLVPAISLYKRLGFVEAERDHPSPFERSNCFMKLDLV